MTRKYKAILLDLGGVLIQLTGMPTMMQWTGNALSVDQFWQRWLTSRAVRDFESGRSSSQAFADSVISEFDLPVKPDEFLTRFIGWPRQTYPGTAALLGKLNGSYRLGTLSNTNALHWKRFQEKMSFLDFFDVHFPSHLTGWLKPDQEAFENTIRCLGVSPGEIVFFDDNRLNVEGARSAGMHAHVVSGVEGLSKKLYRLGMLA
jgi:glucose-1-phosphatase